MIKQIIRLEDYVSSVSNSALANYMNHNPWDITNNASMIVLELISSLENPSEYKIKDDIAIHTTAEVEPGAILKGPLIIGPACYIASSAYIRGGNWLESNCILGPGVELKSSFLFSGTKLAHFNFVGDSIIGSQANLEAGSIIANYRNERADKDVYVLLNGDLINTKTNKFGALIGDDCKIGANAVLAPGSLMLNSTVLPRLTLLDQERNAVI